VRVGDYRIVYAIDDAEKSVQVRIIGHRRDVYERLRRL
jgi:mRNA-degrading endonuclease RelE of RelBE toxin-antitoxin system